MKITLTTPKPVLVLAKASLIALGALITSHSAFAAKEFGPTEKAELLKKLEHVRNAHPAIQSNFVEEKTTPLLNKPVITQGTIFFQYPNKFRRDITGKNPSTTVCNGKILWIYYPNFKEVEQYALGERKAFDDSISALTTGLSFEQLEANYQFRAWQEDNGGYKLELVPKRPNIRRLVEVLTLWMSPDYIALRSQAQLPKGGRVSTRYSSAKREPLPASTFEFVPPADARVTKPLGK
jgi:outer membrane lipoprotein-sorting protein